MAISNNFNYINTSTVPVKRRFVRLFGLFFVQIEIGIAIEIKIALTVIIDY